MQSFASQTPRVIYRNETSPLLELAVVPVRTPSAEEQHWHLLTAHGGQPGVVCLVVHDHRLLIGRHWRLPERQEEWEFPRGFGELGETTEDSARR
jgi:ADP-ribose pyrophosphatase